MTTWEAIFLQSPVNEGYYDEEELPYQPWQWPKATWFQSRLELLREQEAAALYGSIGGAKHKGDPQLN